MKPLLVVDESIRLGLEMDVKPCFWSGQMISLCVSIEAGEAQITGPGLFRLMAGRAMPE